MAEASENLVVDKVNSLPRGHWPPRSNAHRLEHLSLRTPQSRRCVTLAASRRVQGRRVTQDRTHVLGGRKGWMSTRWQRIARQEGGEDYAALYADRFRAMAAKGSDVHGEANFVTGVTAAPARVLDAGCGTGRVAARLAQLGYDVVGCDVDPQMIAVARQQWPTLDWRVADLAGLQLNEAFDVVLLAGNVVPLLEPGTLAETTSSLAAHVAAHGHLVAGFGLDAAHLPEGCPPLSLATFDAAMADVRMRACERWATWDRQPFQGDGYVVAVYQHVTAVSHESGVRSSQ